MPRVGVRVRLRLRLRLRLRANLVPRVVEPWNMRLRVRGAGLDLPPFPASASDIQAKSSRR